MYNILMVSENRLEMVGLKALFSDKDQTVCAMVEADEQKACDIIGESSPCLMLVDFDSCDRQIDSLTKNCKQRFDELKVIWLTRDDSNTIKFDAIGCGADGCVCKSDFDEVIEAVKQVANDGYYFSQKTLMDFAKNACLLTPHIGRKMSLLSAREKEVLELVRSGATNGEIAKMLYVSPETIKVHLRHIRRTLGFSNRRQLVINLSD